MGSLIFEIKFNFEKYHRLTKNIVPNALAYERYILIYSTMISVYVNI